MAKAKQIAGTIEAWENGELGRDEDFVKVVDDPELDRTIDEALELKLISIRLQNQMIDDLKLIAENNQMGYQPLIKAVLARFIEGEFKRYARENLRRGEQQYVDDDEPPIAACG